MTEKKASKEKSINYGRCTQADVCRILRKKPSRINEWSSKDGFPISVDGNGRKWYDIAKIFEWRVNRERELVQDLLESAHKSESQKKLEKAKAQREAARARREERKDMIEAKEYVSIDDVSMSMSTIAKALWRRLERLKKDYGLGIMKKFKKIFDATQREVNRQFPEIQKKQKENLAPLFDKPAEKKKSAKKKKVAKKKSPAKQNPKKKKAKKK